MNLRHCKIGKSEHNSFWRHAHQLIPHRHVEYFNAGTINDGAPSEFPDAFRYTP